MNRANHPALKKTAAALSLALTSIGIAHAASVAVTGTFTMYDSTGEVVGTPDTTVSGAYDIEAMTFSVSSTVTFFGLNWTASGGVLYAPGGYNININGDGSDELASHPAAPLANGDGLYSFTVPTGNYGGNINFAWGSTTGIDVFMVWDLNRTSIDVEGDGIPGARMVDGPFPGFSANFDLTFTDMPVPFTFSGAGDVSPGVQVESNPVTLYVIGWTNSLNISAADAGGATASEIAYSVDGGVTYSAWMTSGSIPAQASGVARIKARHTSSMTDDTDNDTVVTVGNAGSTITRTFRSHTVVVFVPDTSPDAWSFGPNPKTNQTPGAQVESDAFQVKGINTATPISVVGGEYSVSIDGVNWTWNSPATVELDNYVKVRHFAAATFSTSIDTDLTIGDLTQTFTSTTVAEDTDPDPATFNLGTRPNVQLSTSVESNEITVTGINTAVPISISGAADSQYAISTDNGVTYGAWTAGPGDTVVTGNKVKVRHTSSSAFGTQTDTVLTIGAGSGTFSSTTLQTTTMSSTENNFTMLDIAGVLVGGTNDVTFAWDGTLNTDPATAVENASIVSAGPTPFFGQNWTAYNVKIYGEGTYIISTIDSSTDGDCPFAGMTCVSGTGNKAMYTVTVNPGQIMAHMKFAWGATQGIDVIDVWQPGDWTALNPNSQIWTFGGGSYRGPTYDYVSTDWDGDGVAGAEMFDGPFQGYRANFSVMITGSGTGNSERIPETRTAPTSKKMPGCTISARPISPLERGDWWLVAGFIGWLAWVRRRTQRQSLH